MEKTIVELFAGVGGFRVGLERSSNEWKTLWANQWEPNKTIQHAFECYKQHFKDEGGINEYSNIDIAQVNSDNIPNHTLLVGGFPCQDYSVASTGAKGILGKKGVLWWEIERIVRNKKPPFILLENVDRLLKSPSSQRGRDFGIILSCLNNLDYSVEWRVINAGEYGLQQRRRRVFIFATRNNIKYSKSKNKNAEKFLLKTGFFASLFPVSKKSQKVNETEVVDDLVAVSNFFQFQFQNSGYMHNGVISTIETTPNKLNPDKQIFLGDMLEEKVDEKFFISEDDMKKWKYMKGAKAIERTSKTGHEYTFREGAIAFPDFLDKPARTILTSEASKNRSTHVILDPQEKRLRKLTPIECERINGFPDNWTNTGMTQSFRYFCMGNALVVDLIRIMGAKIIEIVDKEKGDLL